MAATRHTETDVEQPPQLDRLQRALFDIGRMWRHYEGDIERAIQQITETASRALSIERVSVWNYDAARRTIQCCDLYQSSLRRHSRGVELAAAQYPAYFEAMETEEVIDASDAVNDPRTREFTEAYLKPNTIGAMLDAPIRAGGKLVGVLCHEHVGGVRPFQMHEVNAATYLANMVAAAVEFRRRVENELEAKRSLSLLRAAFEASGAALLAFNAEGPVHEHNRRAIDLWKIPDHLLGKEANPCTLMRHMAAQTKDPEGFIQNMHAALAMCDDEYRHTIEMLDGRIIECISQPQLLDGHVIGRVWSFRDITFQQRIEDELRALSLRDPLTGLANRRRMEEILIHEVRRARRSNLPLSVAVIDIDNFKQINDCHGHDVGDKVIRELATDIRRRLRSTDHAGRWGGEEFVLVLYDTAIEGALRVVEELRTNAARQREGLPRITVSAGVAQYQDGQSVEDLFSAADAKMYEAKRAGRDRVAA